MLPFTFVSLVIESVEFACTDNYKKQYILFQLELMICIWSKEVTGTEYDLIQLMKIM